MKEREGQSNELHISRRLSSAKTACDGYVEMPVTILTLTQMQQSRPTPGAVALSSNPFPRAPNGKRDTLCS